MKIECKTCNHKEEVNLRLFIRILGAAMVSGGFYAWIAYLFAGTGFAFPICAAIVAGGSAILLFQDEILKWLKSHFPCPKCGKWYREFFGGLPPSIWPFPI